MMGKCRVPDCQRKERLRGVCDTHRYDPDAARYLRPSKFQTPAWFCTCESPVLLGNGECTTCRRAPVWATLEAVKTYRAERSEARGQSGCG